MSKLITPEQWKPIGIEALETFAEDAVRSEVNTLVVAGPGAGKTELLAQKACYLLQTKLCRDPKRILAISFKRDAAANLKNRVNKRCHPDLGRRFQSLTFDAFAKMLLDRFLLALPKNYLYKLQENYKVLTTFGPKDVGYFQSILEPPASVGGKDSLMELNSKTFYDKTFLDSPLSYTVNSEENIEAWFRDQLWQKLTKDNSVTFPMIARLVELILRHNKSILLALQTTYSHVFLDEFQDTTYNHYDLIKTAFKNTNTVLTAVGDNKQRIMGWAGAMENAFEVFEQDFSAIKISLTLNYRSAPNLTRIQNYLMHAIDSTATPVQAHDLGLDGEGECQIFLYSSQEAEARHIAQTIYELIQDKGIKPRDICVLTKRNVDKYTPLIITQLNSLGIKARIESEFQDLLSESLTQTLINIFKLVIYKRSPKEWHEALEVLESVRNISEGLSKFYRLENELFSFCDELRNSLQEVNSHEALKSMFHKILTFIGESAFRTLNPQYLSEEFYQSILNDCAKYIWESYVITRDWPNALTDFEGLNSVPIMSIHKSKGLEYHTVIFVGLEDSAFFKFHEQAHEDTCAFFVAFSRAKKQVIFTFCEVRNTGRGLSLQNRKNISVLYDLLVSAGVEPRQIN